MKEVGMEESQTKRFRTSDLYFSAYLCSIDIPLKHTEKEDSPRNKKDFKVIFVFDISDAVLLKAKALFYGGSGTVSAGKFVGNIRSLKSLCYVS